MRITVLALAATAQLGAEAGKPEDAISVQLLDGSEVATPAVVRARTNVTRIFADAGLRLSWCTRAKNCPDWEGRMIVTLAPEAPGRLPRWALAEARAFGGRTIFIYRDRVQAVARGKCF